MALNQNGQAIADALYSGMYEQGVIKILGHQTMTDADASHWYQFRLPILSVILILALLAIGKWFTAYLCKQPKFTLVTFLAAWGILGLIASVAVHPLAAVLLWSAALFFLGGLAKQTKEAAHG